MHDEPTSTIVGSLPPALPTTVAAAPSELPLVMRKPANKCCAPGEELSASTSRSRSATRSSFSAVQKMTMRPCTTPSAAEACRSGPAPRGESMDKGADDDRADDADEDANVEPSCCVCRISKISGGGGSTMVGSGVPSISSTAGWDAASAIGGAGVVLGTPHPPPSCCPI